MNAFKDFGIVPMARNFTGPKVKMSKILNKQIKVLAYKIEDSAFKDKGNGKRLCIQFELAGEKHIVFTVSTNLMYLIGLVPKDKFPFTTTIIEENETFSFT